MNELLNEPTSQPAQPLVYRKKRRNGKNKNKIHLKLNKQTSPKSASVTWKVEYIVNMENTRQRIFLKVSHSKWSSNSFGRSCVFFFFCRNMIMMFIRIILCFAPLFWCRWWMTCYVCSCRSMQFDWSDSVLFIECMISWKSICLLYGPAVFTIFYLNCTQPASQLWHCFRSYKSKQSEYISIC